MTSQAVKFEGIAYMNRSNLPNGSQLAKEQPSSSADVVTERAGVQSLADVLLHLADSHTTQTRMLRSTASKVAAFLGKSPEDISLDLIHLNREGFRRFLESRRHNEAGVG